MAATAKAASIIIPPHTLDRPYSKGPQQNFILTIKRYQNQMLFFGAVGAKIQKILKNNFKKSRSNLGRTHTEM
jgi:hypothetical protein